MRSARRLRAYCAANGLHLVKIFQDVLSGGRADRPGLAEALVSQKATVFVVLKFDRLSRSIKHFCDMYETHFKGGTRELVAIREAIRLDNSSLGRALVSILLVFAQMEREATGERVKETIRHIRGNGYHFGKVPFGYSAIPAPENPRYRLLIENPEEQATIGIIKGWVEEGRAVTAICAELTERQIKPPQGQKVDYLACLYNLKHAAGLAPSQSPSNDRPQSHGRRS
jgi:DNA invertase Pin-like site-specific DNA recombinase